MANDLAALAKRMRERAKGLDDLANNVVIESTEAMLREVVEVTPVDTSEAVSNWQVGVGVKPPAQIPPYFLGKKGSTRGSSSAKAIEEGAAELATKRPGQVVYLSNTAKYIVDLDGGSSTQFAGGFIPRALIVFRAQLKLTLKRLIK